jgi:hypothetical protein
MPSSRYNWRLILINSLNGKLLTFSCYIIYQTFN